MTKEGFESEDGEAKLFVARRKRVRWAPTNDLGQNKDVRN